MRVHLTNTGKVKGQQVVQLYLSFPEDVREHGSAPGAAKVDFPEKVLRGFEKVELEPGESKEVVLQLRRRDVSYWSTKLGNWVMPVDERGKFEIKVGTSSRILPLWGRW